MTPARLALLSLGASVALVTPAWGQSAALLSGPVLDPTSKLRVASEQVTLTCAGDVQDAGCAIVARARIENPTGEAAEAALMMYSLRAAGLSFRAGGEALAPLSGPEAEAVPEPAEAAAFVDREQGLRAGREPARSVLRVRVPAGGSVELTATRRLTLLPSEPSHELPFTVRALNVRHPWAHLGERVSRGFGVRYLASSQGSWSASHTLDLRVRVPSSWSLEGFLGVVPQDPDGVFGRELGPARDVDGLEERRVVLEGPAGSGKGAVRLYLTAEPTDRRIHHGGAFAAIGGAFGAGDVEAFRARVGYEIAVPGWLIESLSFETDFRSRALLTPALEVATPWLFLFVPSFSIGAGVPIQLRPTVTPGARLLLGAHFPIVGIVGTVDVFPALSPEEGQVQGSLMARFSL